MKTIASVILLMCIAAQAAEPFEHPIRQFGKQQADLAPLFEWWDKAAEARGKSKKVQSSLPDRPLPAWVRIKGEFQQGSGNMWKLSALVETKPGESTKMDIYLRSPPEAVRKRQAEINARYHRTLEQRESAHQASKMNREDAQAYSARGSVLDEVRHASGNGGPGGLTDAAARRYRQASDARARADQLSKKVDSLDQELVKLSAARAAFKNRDVYLLDMFALRTGVVIAGRQVLDLGYIPALHR